MKIKAVFQVILAIWELYKSLKEWRKNSAIKEQYEREAKIAAALDAAKKAQSDEEIMDTQRRIADNSN